MKLKKRILVVTSTYPYLETHFNPDFINKLTDGLGNFFEIDIIAPSIRGAKSIQSHLFLFRYCFSRFEIISGGSGISANIRKNPLLVLIIPLFFIFQILKIRKNLDQKNYDAIHAHWIIPQGLSVHLAQIGKKKKVPVLITSHGGDLYTESNYFIHLLKKVILHKSKSVTVVSKTMKRHIINTFKVPKEKITVAPMGVDATKTFTPTPQRIQSIDVLFVGRLVEKKGIDLLIESISTIKTLLPDIHCCIIGEGILKEELVQKAERLDTLQNIKFMGAIPNDELPDYYRRAKVIALPFRKSSSGDQEGLGLTTIEAQCCGRAVVVGNVPAIHDVVKHGINGLIVNTKSSEKLTEALLLVLQNEGLRNKLAAAGVISARKFDWNNSIQKYHALLIDMIQGESNQC